MGDIKEERVEERLRGRRHAKREREGGQQTREIRVKGERRREGRGMVKSLGRGWREGRKGREG